MHNGRVTLAILVFLIVLSVVRCSSFQNEKYSDNDQQQGRYKVWYSRFKGSKIIGNSSGKSTNETKGELSQRYQVATIDWKRVQNYVIVCIWILFAGLARIFFRSRRMNAIVSRVPESCLLICVGIFVGGIAYAIDKSYHIDQLLFNHDTFFLIILPPIVLEAGYFMPREPFFENIGTILTYAIVGTLYNAFAIGMSLYGVFLAGWMPAMTNITILDCLLFGSILSAVDPVAVIAVFEEINVNVVLYICVFGESLLNDGVAVVLYHLFEQYIELPEIIAIDYVAAVASFFVVVLGGLLVGIFYGFFGTFITKYTVKIRVYEPTFVIVTAYLSYLTAEIFNLSSIIAIVFSGFIMNTYAPHNISPKSQLTVKYVMKMMAGICETIIFMLLGVVVFSDYWKHWNTGFVLWTLGFITIHRAIGVVVLTFLLNLGRMDKISYVDQFVMAYGGLRGAIAFSLVSLTSVDAVPAIKTMVCSCIVCILFTSFVQGATIRPIVEFLKVRIAQKHNVTMFEDINMRLIEHVGAGIGDIVGRKGQHYWYYRFDRLNTDYIMKWFVREPYKTRDQVMLETFHQINQTEAETMLDEMKGRRYSSGYKRTNTLPKLLLPPTLERSDSSCSISSEEDSTVEDTGRLIVEERRESSIPPDAAIAHDLLSKNMYQPRVTTSLRYRRGTIDLSSAHKRQEREILIKRHFQERISEVKSFNKYNTIAGMRPRHSLFPDFRVTNEDPSNSVLKEETYGNEDVAISGTRRNGHKPRHSLFPGFRVSVDTNRLKTANEQFAINKTSAPKEEANGAFRHEEVGISTVPRNMHRPRHSLLPDFHVSVDRLSTVNENQSDSILEEETNDAYKDEDVAISVIHCNGSESTEVPPSERTECDTA